MRWFKIFSVLTIISGVINIPALAQQYQLVWKQEGLPTRSQPISGMEEGSAKVKAELQQLISQGYLAVSVDSFKLSDTSLTVYLYKGPVFSTAKLDLEGLPADERLRIQKKFKSKGSISPASYQSLFYDAANEAEKKGYPFANIYLDRVNISDSFAIVSTLVYKRGRLYRIDSIAINGEPPIQRGYILRYLTLKQGAIYNPKEYKNISKKIAALPFLAETKPWDVSFSPARTTLNLFLATKKANQANAIIGVQPGKNAGDKLNITADVLLSLQNTVGYGERFSITYQQLQYQSPRLHTELTFPFVLGTPFSAEGSFDLYKLDTTYRKSTATIGLRYPISAFENIKLSYQYQGNKVITFDTNFLRSQKRLPPNIDLIAQGAGLNFVSNRLDNEQNPSKGLKAELNLDGLQRRGIINNSVDNLSDAKVYDYNRLFDSTIAVATQIRATGHISYTLPVYRSLVLKVAYQGGYISGDNLFTNELYQIGGFKLLRGFDESSIFTPRYNIATLEPRILISPESHLLVFSDFGSVIVDVLGSRSNKFVYSFGAGAALFTKGGLFNIAFGLGNFTDQKFQLRNTKVHFGYSVFF